MKRERKSASGARKRWKERTTAARPSVEHGDDGVRVVHTIGERQRDIWGVRLCNACMRYVFGDKSFVRICSAAGRTCKRGKKR
jgi:hypothetical protein